MGTIVRRKRIWSRHEIGPYRRHELLTGEIVYSAFNYTGYGDGIGRDLHAFITEEMRADWEINRDELLAFWKTGNFTTSEHFPGSLPWLFVRGYPHTLPWAAKALDTMEPSDGAAKVPSRGARAATGHHRAA